jgi:SAM-dependent MidA family methyltransferase
LATCEVFTGVHYSNELVDAMPFHLLKSDGNTWSELFVENAGETFQFVEAPVSEAIARQTLPVRPAGFVIEERPSARQWVSDVAARLGRGFLLAMDYGYPRAERLAAHRTRGTFASYKNHVRDENLLDEPGTRDLTAHVDFSDLAEAGHAAGLVPCGFCDQHHFVIGAAENLLRNLDGADPSSAPAKILRSLKSLMHPETMGTQFHAFCMATDPALAKGLPAFRKSWNHFDRLLS